MEKLNLRLPPREREAHKARFGRILVVAGSRAMPGAAALATLAALRGGAGLVTLAAVPAVLDRVASRLLCATHLPLPEGRGGGVDAGAAEELLQRRGEFDAFVLGPGLGISEGVRAFFRRVVNGWPGPLVLDADGLNALALERSAWVREETPRILTPHPGEMARLSAGALRSDPPGRRVWAEELARELGAIVVLKGARTVVSDGVRAFVNDTGNPGMATGGSGDVLAGLIAALVVRPGLELFEATCLSVYAHGIAGDLAARTLGEDGMIAEDLLDYLPRALLRLSAGPRERGDRQDP